MDNKGHLTMRNLPVGDRPCEKLHKYGAHSLSDAELLAVIIRSGNRQESAVALCQRLLSTDAGKQQGLAALADISLEELTSFAGIGRVKASQLKAALEVGSRSADNFRNSERFQIHSPDDAIRLLEPEMHSLPREELRAILLDIRNRVIRISKIAVGGLSASVITPRDLFHEAIRANAASLILAHNHPSGDATPSSQDLETTRRLKEAGEMMGIRIMDHLIVASSGTISLRRQNLL